MIDLTETNEPGGRTDLMKWIGLRLSVVANRYTYALYAEIERTHNLLRDEAAVIVCAAAKNGLTAQEIVRYTGRPKNSIARAIHKLEAAAMLGREGDAADGRTSRLSLTGRGRSLFKKIEGIYAERDRRMISLLSDREKKEFNRILMKISDASPSWM